MERGWKASRHTGAPNQLKKSSAPVPRTNPKRVGLKEVKDSILALSEAVMGFREERL